MRSRPSCSTGSARRQPGAPDCRLPSRSPPPRSRKSSSAMTKPSSVSRSRRAAAAPSRSARHRAAAGSNSRPAPRPTRPRNWCNCARPNRSACSTTMTLAAGTSTPTSITVVATSSRVSPAAKARQRRLAHAPCPAGHARARRGCRNAAAACVNRVLGRRQIQQLALAHHRADPEHLVAAIQRPRDAVDHVAPGSPASAAWCGSAAVPPVSRTAGSPPSRPIASAAACAGWAWPSSPARRSSRLCRPATAAGPRRSGAARRSPPAPDPCSRHPPGTARGCPPPAASGPVCSPSSVLRRATPFTEPVSSATGTGADLLQRAVMLPRQRLGRRHHRRLRAGFHRAQHGQWSPPASCRSRHRPAAAAACGSAAAMSVSISASAAACEAVSAWPNRRQRRRAQRAITAQAHARAGRAPACASRPAQPGAPATRHRRAAPRTWRRDGQAARAAPAALRRSPASPRVRISAGSCHPGGVGIRASAWAIAARTWLGNSPAVSGQTGSSAGSRSGRSAGTMWSGCAMRQPVAERSSLPDTSSRPPTASACARAGLKNTSSAKPGAVRHPHPPGLARHSPAARAAPPRPPASPPAGHGRARSSGVAGGRRSFPADGTAGPAPASPPVARASSARHGRAHATQRGQRGQQRASTRSSGCMQAGAALASGTAPAICQPHHGRNTRYRPRSMPAAAVCCSAPTIAARGKTTCSWAASSPHGSRRFRTRKWRRSRRSWNCPTP